MSEPPQGPGYGPPPDPSEPGPGPYGQPYGQPPYGQPQGDPQYAPPSYGPQAFGSQYGPPTTPAPAARAPLAQRLGTRLLQRPEPRFGTSVAAAGAVLVLLGVLVWAGGYLGTGIHVGFDDDLGRTTISGGDRNYLGAALAAVVVAAGYAVLVLRRTGPLATAGAVASAFGVPLLLEFLTFDLASTLQSGDFPVSIDAVYLVSIAVWVASYLAVPGARGRGFYVGLVATGVASYVGLKAAGSQSLLRAGASVSGLGGSGGSGGTDALVAVGLIFGLGYYALAALLDRRGRHGASVGLVFAGFVTTWVGVIAAVPSFEQVGTGVLLVVVGLALAWYGARSGRRFTTWVWTGAFVVGVGVIVEKFVTDSYTAAGIALIAVGVVVAGAAQVVSRRESPDLVEAGV